MDRKEEIRVVLKDLDNTIESIVPSKVNRLSVSFCEKTENEQKKSNMVIKFFILKYKKFTFAP